MERVEVLDTTLRDGMQGEGVSFSYDDKIKVVEALDRLGVDYIEAGNPAASRRDADLIRALAARGFSHAEIVAFGSTRRAGTDAREDAGLLALINSGTKYVSIFGKSSAFHVSAVLGVEKDENLRMIADSVGALKGRGRKVFFDAEHFFDGYAEDEEYALATLSAAARAGAEALVLCDTNGGRLPEEISGAVRAVRRAFELPVAIHCHDDAGLATAGTLAAVSAGAVQVQGTINGYGERCGNANLCEVIPNIELKLNRRCLPEGKLRHLAGTAAYISDIANITMDPKAPYVGRSAFTHKGGMHIDGMIKDSRTFEHVDPALVGNGRRYLMSEMAGRGALMTRLKVLAPELKKNSEQTAAIVDMLKGLEGEGYTFEDADGSLALRVLGEIGRRRVYFSVLDFHVSSYKPESLENSQAYVKVEVDGRTEITADEGNGPVNALDLALRKALTRFYPFLSEMKLTDFKVRVVGGMGTSSKVRVHIESSDGANNWSTVGVSNNVIEASFIAMTDSIEYMLMNRLGGGRTE